MIFYTLLSHYHNIDKTNVVLTAMIMYIIVYIIVEPEWNYIALTVIALLDLILMQDWRFIWGQVSLVITRLYSLLGFTPKLILHVRSRSKHVAQANRNVPGRRSEKKKSPARKHKRVKFSNRNQYYEYPAWDGFTRASNMGMDRMHPVNTRQIGGASQSPHGWMGMGGFQPQYPGGVDGIPQWQLTPLQQMQQIQMQQMQKAQQQGAMQQSPMIDNRHLAIHDPSEVDNQDESIASDVSSELSNYEEGLFD